MKNLNAENINEDILCQFNMINDTIKDLSKFLHDNPEESFKEYKSAKYIVNILKKFDFDICEGFMDIPTAFVATKGSGHPKICFICEYDADPEKGHITGNNLSASSSIAAALSLAPIINNIDGTIMVMGCPGQLKNSCDSVLVKQGAFDDIDAAFIIRPYTYNGYINSSDAHLPVKLSFEWDKEKIPNIPTGVYSPSDACILTLNFISVLSRGLLSDCSINNVSYEENTVKLDIKTKSIDQAEALNEKIKSISNAISECMNLSFNTCLHAMPCHEFINNSTLLRLFAHNLKQNGIIEIKEFNPKGNLTGCGCISSAVPCISPFISIVPENKNIEYKSHDFAECAASDYAFSTMIKAAKTLAFTACDLLQKKSLLEEAILNIKTPKHYV